MEVDWVRVYSGEDSYVPADPGTVPDVVGSNLRDAVTRLARRGIRPIIVGSGIVVSQEPAAGLAYGPGAECVLKLEDDPSTPVRPVAAGRAAG